MYIKCGNLTLTSISQAKKSNVVVISHHSATSMRTADSHSEVSIMARMMVKMNITTTMMILQVIRAAWPHLPLQTKQDQSVLTTIPNQ